VLTLHTEAYSSKRWVPSVRCEWKKANHAEVDRPFSTGGKRRGVAVISQGDARVEKQRVDQLRELRTVITLHRAEEDLRARVYKVVALFGAGVKE